MLQEKLKANDRKYGCHDQQDEDPAESWPASKQLRYGISLPSIQLVIRTQKIKKQLNIYTYYRLLHTKNCKSPKYFEIVKYSYEYVKYFHKLYILVSSNIKPRPWH